MSDDWMKGTLALILAGGKGLRMGRPKYDVQVAGKSLLELAISKVELIGVKKIIIPGVRTKKPLPAHIVTIEEDANEKSGPLRGLIAASAHNWFKNAEWVWVLPVDAPLVLQSQIHSLLELTTTDDYDVVVPSWKNDGGKMDPVWMCVRPKTLVSIIDGKGPLQNRILEHRYGCVMWNMQSDGTSQLNYPSQLLKVRKVLRNS